MPSTKDIVIGDVVQAMIYGKFKTGKTWGALTFPRPNVMDFDRGINVARNPLFVEQYGLLDIQYEQFRDVVGPGGVPKSHTAFDAACKYFDKWMAPANSSKFDTWVVDSGTTLSRASLNKAVILLGGSGFSGASSKTHDAAKQHGLMLPKLQDYGAERSMVQGFLSMLLGSEKHVLFVCHEQPLYDTGGGLVGYGPLLTGKSVEEVPLMFDEVWRLQRKRKGSDFEHVIRTVPEGGAMAGSRIGIPDGTKYEWPAIQEALNNIRKVSQAQTVESGPSMNLNKEE